MARRARRPLPHSPLIRPARRDDSELIRRIYNEAVRTTTATFDTEPRTASAQRTWLGEHDPRHPVFVAQFKNTVVGWASLSPWSDRNAYRNTAETSVYVASRWRGRGVGRALLSAILAKARQSGLHTIIARIAVGNPASRALHLSAGFTPVGVMHEVGYKFDRLLDVELLELRMSHASQGSTDIASEEPARPSS